MRCACWAVLLFCVLQVGLCYVEDSGERARHQFSDITLSDIPKTTNAASLRTNLRNQASVRWRYLGGPTLSRPCCVSWGPGRVDCFIRNRKNIVLHKSITKKDDGKREYSDWEEIGGVYIMGEIECVSRDKGIIDILALGKTNNLLVNGYKRGVWSGWENKGGTLMEPPSCVSQDKAKVECMLRLGSNQSSRIAKFKDKWGGFQLIAGTFHHPIACSTRVSNIVDCYAAGNDNNVFENSLGFFGWSPIWIDRQGRIKSKPSITTWEEQRLDIFGLGADNSVQVRVWDHGKWFDWVSLGGVFDSAPECVTTGPDKIHCFAIGYGHKLDRNSWNGKAWSGWIRDSDRLGRFLETPSCVVSDADEVSCYVRNANVGITEIVYKF